MCTAGATEALLERKRAWAGAYQGGRYEGVMVVVYRGGVPKEELSPGQPGPTQAQPGPNQAQPGPARPSSEAELAQSQN